MKNIILLIFTLAIMSSCTQQVAEQRYFSSSPEIDVSKALREYYVAADWEAYASHFAPDAEICNNVKKGNGTSVDKLTENWKDDFQTFSSIRLDPDEDYYEMVITEEGEKWVNYWGMWEATLNATGQQFSMPIHITSQFVDGKIVQDHRYFNNHEIILAVMALSQTVEE
jgi:hypothetical protein